MYQYVLSIISLDSIACPFCIFFQGFAKAFHPAPVFRLLCLTCCSDPGIIPRRQLILAAGPLPEFWSTGDVSQYQLDQISMSIAPSKVEAVGFISLYWLLSVLSTSMSIGL